MRFHRTLFSDRIVEMLKERKVWCKLRELEKARKNATIKTVSIGELNVSIAFRDSEKLSRILASLVKQELIKEYEYHEGNGYIKRYATEPKGDTHFHLLYFWNKWIDEVGFKKIVWLVIVVTSLIASFKPNSIGYKIIEIIEKAASRILG